MKKAILKTLKISVIAAASLIIIASIGLAVVRYIFSEDKIKEIISSEAGRIAPTHRLMIGNLRYGLSGLVITDAALFDADSQALLEASEINLGFSLFDLINKNLKINSISVNNLKLNLKFDESNKLNIQKLIEEAMAARTNGSSIKAEVSLVSLSDAEISVINPKGLLEPLGGTYGITADLDISEKQTVGIKNCTLTLPEERGVMQPELTITWEKGGSTVVAGDVKLKPASLLWVYKWAKHPNPQPYSLLRGDAKDLRIEITADKNVIVTGHAVSTSTLTGVPYLLTADGYCEVNVKKRTLRLMNVKGRVDSSTIFLQEVFVGFKGELYNFAVRDAVTDIAHIRALLRFIPPKIFGLLKGNLSYSESGYSGEVTVENGGFDREANLISNINTHLSIANSQVKQTGIPVNLLGNKCIASVATTDSTLRRIFVDIKTDRFQIVNEKQADSGETEAVPVPVHNVTKSIETFPIVITGRIDAGSVTYDKLRLENASLNYSLTESLISVPRFSASFMQGQINGTGNLSFAGTAPAASVKLDFGRIAMQELAAFLPDMKDRIYGFASGTLNASFPLGRELISALKGNLGFRIDKGKIVNTGIQNGLGLWLSELKYKLTDLEFNAIMGDIDIANGNYMINSFLFTSENIRLSLQGMLNGKMETPNMNISLEFTPKFVQDVPTMALALQNRRNGNWYRVPFVGKGKITDGKNIRMQ